MEGSSRGDSARCSRRRNSSRRYVYSRSYERMRDERACVGLPTEGEES